MPGPTYMVRLAPPAQVVSLPSAPPDPVAAAAEAPKPAPREYSQRLDHPEAVDASGDGRHDDDTLVAHAERGHGRSFAERMADSAEHLLGHDTPNGFRRDCSGFVCAAADRAGLVMDGGSDDLWKMAEEAGTVHHRKRPARGDLVFFDRTWDKNNNGRNDDELTHIGVVLSVDAEGTIKIAHRSSSQGLAILHMNLYHPDEEKGPEGQPWNDGLRAPSRHSSASTPRLSGELCRGFGTIEDGDLAIWEADGTSDAR